MLLLLYVKISFLQLENCSLVSPRHTQNNNDNQRERILSKLFLCDELINLATIHSRFTEAVTKQISPQRQWGESLKASSLVLLSPQI